jgi:hypothetical protein
MPDSPRLATVLRLGGCYTVDYVHRLARQLKDHYPAFTPLYCLTDANDDEFDKTLVLPLPLLERWPGWWAKLNLFSQHYFGAAPVVYFDLDTFILKSIAPLIRDIAEASRHCDLVLLSDVSGNGKMATGVMGWQSSSFTDKLFAHFASNPAKWMSEFSDGGDQHYLRAYYAEIGGSFVRIQDITQKETVVSYKWGAQFQPPPMARVVCFHGHPKPHEVESGWAAEHWKKYA